MTEPNPFQLIEWDRKMRHGRRTLYDLNSPENPWDAQATENHIADIRNKYFNLERRIGLQRPRFNVKRYNKDVLDKLYNTFLAILPHSLRKHVVIAGGAVYSCAYTKQRRGLNINDVDIFIHGITDEEKAKGLIDAIYYTYNYIFKPQYTTRSKSALSLAYFRNTTTMSTNEIFCDKIQIIFRLYQDIPQILYGFDMQCAALAMEASAVEGQDTYSVSATTLAMYTHATGMLPLDTSRRSLTFERRINKYMSKGTRFIFPHIDGATIAPIFSSTSSYIIDEHDDGGTNKSRAYIKLGNCTLALSYRTGNVSYVGELTNFAPINAASTRNYAYKAGNTNAQHNTFLIKKAIAEKQTEQPDLYIQIDNELVTQDVDIRKQRSEIIQFGRRRRRFSRKALKRYRNLVNYRLRSLLTFDPIYKLEFRKVAPDSQWTSSFDPVRANAQDWYGSTYYVANGEVSTRLRITSSADIETPSYTTDNYLDRIARDSNDQPASELKVLMYNPKYKILSGLVKGKILYIRCDYYCTILFRNSLKEKESQRYSMDDLKFILSQFIAPNEAQELPDFEKVLETNLYRRAFFIKNKKDILFPEGGFAYLQDGAKLYLSLRAKARLDNVKKLINPPSSLFKWEDMCKVTSGVPLDQLREQAKHFKVDKPILKEFDKLKRTDGLKAKRFLCKVIAEQAEIFLAPFAVECENADEYDSYATTMRETPPVIVWSKTASNGKTYCYNLFDMVQMVNASNSNSVAMDPSNRFILSDSDKQEIKDRYAFLKLVLNTVAPEGRTTFTEYFSNMAAQAKRNNPATLASLLHAQLAESPLTAEQLSQLSKRQFRLLFGYMEELSNTLQMYQNSVLDYLTHLVQMTNGSSAQSESNIYLIIEALNLLKNNHDLHGPMPEDMPYNMGDVEMTDAISESESSSESDSEPLTSSFT